MRPAGVTRDGIVNWPIGRKTAQETVVAPDAARLLSIGLPLSILVKGARSEATPDELRAEIAKVAFVRAILLDRPAAAAEVSAIVIKHHAALAEPVAAVLSASTPEGRRQELAAMMLRFPKLSIDAVSEPRGPAEESPINRFSERYLWCASRPETPIEALHEGGFAEVALSFLTPEERARARSEQAALHGLGSGPTWVARRAADLAEKKPGDPRAPELLHLAVAATQFGCRDENNTKASRRAFRILHRAYGDTEWARKTPYYY